jgi:DNA adenine methylase
MAQSLRSPLKRIGGKAAAAMRIVTAFPDAGTFDTYVEPCAGACHVLMAKPVYGHEEIINDLDGNLIAFWKEMLVNAPAMQAYLDRLPYARALYYDFYRSLFDGSDLNQFDRAVRYFYCLRSTGTGWLRRSPVGWNHKGSNVCSFRSALELFEAVADRLKYVAIDNRDVLASVKRYDSPRTLFYVDPPYINAESYYEASKHGFPHADLAALLNQVQGYVTLSYYPDPELEQWYPVSKWQRMTWLQHKSSQIAQEASEEDRATEMLLCNYGPMKTLWSKPMGEA